ncbi:hypothetical protein [Nonomuraea sp. NPDC049400]|uniref:hypothetical protein n=1 Tax=Nonomuraea sp. NPDC049400 TaxID=3364352 RepID=UPI00379113D8
MCNVASVDHDGLEAFLRFGVCGKQLGTVTVSDQRAALNATWVASVSAASGGFTTGGGTAAETIPNSAVLYWSGPATATTGTGTFGAGQANAAAAETLAATRTAFSKTTGSGDDSAAWNPTLVINVPDAAVAGTYTGTVLRRVMRSSFPPAWPPTWAEDPRWGLYG